MKSIILLTTIITLALGSIATAQPITKFISKAEADSFNTVIATAYQNAPNTTVTVGMMVMNNKLMMYRMNQTFMTLSKLAKNGEMAKFRKLADSVMTQLRNQATLLGQGITVLDGRTTALDGRTTATDQRVDNIENLISAEDALDDDEFTDSQRAILAKIRDDVAKRCANPIAGAPKRY